VRGYTPQSYEPPSLDPIDALSAAAEQADLAYGIACDAHAVAKNVEDKAYFTALLTGDESSEAGKDRHGRSLTVEERAVRRIKEAAMESAKEHLRTVLARLSAAQTKFRAVDRLGG
jgi:hypothetical protein